MYKIILADDHPIVRIGIKDIINATLDLAVVDEAGSGRELIEKIKRNNYDAVLFDIYMHDNEGLDILKEIKKVNSALPVLIFSIYHEEQYAVRLLKAGASGFINKGVEPDALIDALRKIVKGGKYITPSVAEQLAASFDLNDGGPVHEKLTDREFQVMCLIASGLKLKEIAQKLSLSINTINSYRIIILEKLGLKSNVELTHYAIKNKLIE